MLKKYCVFVLVLLMFGTANGTMTVALSQTENQPISAEKWNGMVAEAGAGKKVRVTVTLRNSTTLAGYLGEVRKEGFTLIDNKTKNPVTVLYADAVKIKRNKLPLAAKIGIGIGIGVAVYVVVAAIATKGFQKTGN